MKSLIALLFLLLTFTSCKRIDQKSVDEANLRAYQDSVRVAELRDGQLEYSRRIHVLDNTVNTLRDELKQVGKRVEVLTKTKATVKIDTLKIETVVKETFEGLTASWVYKDNLVGFRGSTVIPDSGRTVTTIRDMTFEVYLLSGIRELKDDNFEFFVRPTDPRVSVEMEGLIVNRRRFGYTRPRRWVIGLGGGYGLGFGGFTPFAGIFVGRKLVTF